MQDVLEEFEQTIGPTQPVVVQQAATPIEPPPAEVTPSGTINSGTHPVATSAPTTLAPAQVPSMAGRMPPMPTYPQRVPGAWSRPQGPAPTQPWNWEQYREERDRAAPAGVPVQGVPEG